MEEIEIYRQLTLIQQHPLINFLSVLIGVAFGIFGLWKLFRKVQTDIEAPMREEIRRCHAEKNELAKQIMTQMWDGIAERRTKEHDDDQS